MFRVSPLRLRTTHILIRRSPTLQVQVTSISRSPVLFKSYKRFDEPEREPCPPKIPLPPCPPPPKNRNFLWTTLAFFILIGVATVKAKDSKEFRDWISIYAPYFDEFVSAVLQENKPIGDSLKEFSEYCKQTFKDWTKPYPEECNLDKSDTPAIAAPPPPEPVSYEEPPKASEESTEAEGGGDGAVEEEGDKPADDEFAEEEKICELTPPDKITKDVCQFEACIKDLGDDIYHNYLTAKDACQFYNNLVNNTMKDFSFDGVEELKKEKKIRIELVNKSMKNVKNLQKQFYDLLEYVKCACDAPPERLETTLKLIKEYEDKIARVRIDYQKADQRAAQRDVQWQIVVAQVDIFCERMTSMYPEIDFKAKKPHIKGDVDFYLLLMYKYLEVLKAKAVAAADLMEKRAHRAVLQMDAARPPPPPPDPKAPKPKAKKGEEPPTNTEGRCKEAESKAQSDLNKEYDDRDKSIKQKHDNEIKQVLADQKKEFERTLEQMMKQREEQVRIRFNKLVADKVAIQKKIFDDDIAKMRAQMQGVEGNLEAKEKAEKESQRAQDLYMAGMALLGATRRGEPRVCVRRTLQAIKTAAVSQEGDEPDPLVMTVLNGIPAEVWEKGVVPESVLRHRYNSMEDVAQKVAMVEAEGSPMPVYAISWLQAKLVGLIKCNSIPQVELDDPPKEPFEGLDTFDLLQRARFFVERGNLAKAMRYVDSLEGASRAAAEGWHRAASEHLQTRQAAEAIIAHAAALSLQYL